MRKLLFRSNGKIVGEYPVNSIVPRKNESVTIDGIRYDVRDVNHNYESVYITIDVVPAFTGNQL